MQSESANSVTELHPIQVSPEFAEQAFGFLSGLGFRLDDRWVTGGSSFKDGWRLIYRSHNLEVRVQYLDMQFEVLFLMANRKYSYLHIDRHFFGGVSGYHGNMFPPEKLETVIPKVARDIQQNYVAILSGQETKWAKMQRLLDAPTEKKRLP